MGSTTDRAPGQRLKLAALSAVVAVVIGGGGAGGPAADVGPGDLGMEGNVLSPDVREMHQGDSLGFVDDSSHSLHILVIGDEVEARDEFGAPRFGGSGGVRTDPGETWTSPAWHTPGTYHAAPRHEPRGARPRVVKPGRQ